jgi:hypothetical protein
MMQQEAEITVNGARLINNEARMVRLALASFADIMNPVANYAEGVWAKALGLVQPAGKSTAG